MATNTPNKTDGWLLTQPQRCYTPAAKTDIRDTFKSMGWIAPSESKKPIIGIKTKEQNK